MVFITVVFGNNTSVCCIILKPDLFLGFQLDFVADWVVLSQVLHYIVLYMSIVFERAFILGVVKTPYVVPKVVQSL